VKFLSGLFTALNLLPAWVGGAVVSGQAHTKQAAVVSAEKAIDRALAIQKIRLVPPERSD
jgi:hypothetical protein